MPFQKFDRSWLQPLAERVQTLDLSVMIDPDAPANFAHPSIDILAERIRAVKERGDTIGPSERNTTFWMMRTHVLRAGNATVLIRLMKEGGVTHFALNGAGAIHDTISDRGRRSLSGPLPTAAKAFTLPGTIGIPFRRWSA